MKTENRYQEAFVLLSCHFRLNNQICYGQKKPEPNVYTILKEQDNKTKTKKHITDIDSIVSNLSFPILTVLRIVSYINYRYISDFKRIGVNKNVNRRSKEKTDRGQHGGHSGIRGS